MRRQHVRQKKIRDFKVFRSWNYAGEVICTVDSRFKKDRETGRRFDPGNVHDVLRIEFAGARGYQASANGDFGLVEGDGEEGNMVYSSLRTFPGL